jgi:hypothetical protein
MYNFLSLDEFSKKKKTKLHTLTFPNSIIFEAGCK